MPLSAPFVVGQRVRVMPHKLTTLGLLDVPYRVLEVCEARSSTTCATLVLETSQGPIVVRQDEAIIVEDANPPALSSPVERGDLFIGPGYVVTKAGGPLTFDDFLVYESHPVDEVPEPTRTAMRGLRVTLAMPGMRAAMHAFRYAVQQWQDAKKA